MFGFGDRAESRCSKIFALRQRQLCLSWLQCVQPASFSHGRILTKAASVMALAVPEDCTMPNASGERMPVFRVQIARTESR